MKRSGFVVGLGAVLLLAGIAGAAGTGALPE